MSFPISCDTLKLKEVKRRVVSGEDEVLEICEVVEENGISMKIVL